MSQPIRDQRGHFVFSIHPKNTNLVEEVEILLPVKFRGILISRFRKEVENVSANQRPGWPSCFSDRPEKHKLWRGLWEMSWRIRGQGHHLHLVFPISSKNTNLVEDFEVLLPVKFRWIQFSAFREEVENVSANQRSGGPSCFSIWPKKYKFGEDFEILLPVKFPWILFSCFREEVENVSANQRPGRPSCFSYQPEKHKPGRGCWDLASCQVSLNSVTWFQRRSQMWKVNDGRTTDRRTYNVWSQ